MSDRAVIQATFEGAGQVASEAKKVGGALKEAKTQGEGVKDAAGGAGNAVKTLTKAAEGASGGLGSMAKGLGLIGGPVGALAIAGIVKTVEYFGQAKKAAQDFQERTSVTSRRIGVDVGGLRDTFGRLEVDTHQSADAQADFLASMQRTSYSGKESIDSLRGLGREAKATGRDLAEFSPITASLQTGLRVTGDVTDEMAKLRDMAERLGTVGGPEALVDTIAALRPAFEQVSIGSDQARTKVEAFVAALQKHMRPEQAQAVASGAVGLIKGRALDIERITGQGTVLDENGQVKDPVGILKALQGWGQKKYGKDQAAFRRASIGFFGPELGSMIASGKLLKDTDETAKTADGAEQKKRMDAAYKNYLENDPMAARETAQIHETQRDRAAGKSALALSDAYGQATDLTAIGHSFVQVGHGAAQTVGQLASDVGGGLHDAAKGATGSGAAVSKGLSEASKGAEGTWSNIVKGFQDALRGAHLIDEKKVGDAVAVALRNSPMQVKVPRDPNENRGN